MDYRKPQTSVSASTYSSEYPQSLYDPNYSTLGIPEREHLGRESTGFLFALTYPRRKASHVVVRANHGNRELHDKFLTELRLDEERRRVRKNRSASARVKGSAKRTSLASLVLPPPLLTNEEDVNSGVVDDAGDSEGKAINEQSLSGTDAETGPELSRSVRSQQSFLRKKFGSMGKKSQRGKRTTHT